MQREREEQMLGQVRDWAQFDPNHPIAKADAVERASRASQAVHYGADPADAPLPGEETQPPEVAAANQRKARASGGWDLGAKGLEGMSDIERVAAMADGMVTQDEINASRDRQNAAADARHAGFERAMGLPGAEPAAAPAPVQPRYQPKTGLAANMAPDDENMQRQWDEWSQSRKDFVERTGMLPEEKAHAIPTGMPGETRVGGKLVHVSKAPTPEQHKRNVDFYKRRKKNSYFNSIAHRFDDQIMAAGETATLEHANKTYDDAFAKAEAEGLDGNRAHLAAVNAVNDKFVDGPVGLRNAKEKQLANNVQRLNEQREMARAMTGPSGIAILMDTLQQARTAQDQFSVLMTAYQLTGNPAFGQAAMTIMRGHQDQQSLAQWQAGQQRPVGGVAQAAGDRQQIDNMPFGEARLAAAEAHATAQNGGQVLTPDQRSTVRKNEAITATRQMIAAGQRPNAQQIAAMRVLSRDYTTFASEIGLPLRDPKAMALYKEVHGIDPPAVTWQEGAQAVGELVGSGLNSVANYFRGTPPNNGAQAGQ
jgi:hypothetical protein